MDGLKGKFPVVISQDLSWGDMDAFQHINNTVYFRYFEDIRIAYFDKIKVVEFKERSHFGPILASTRCDFRIPLAYPDTVHIGALVEDIQRKRFKMKYHVYSQRLGQLAAEGEGLIVYYDYHRQKSCEIPPTIIAAIKALDGA